MAIEWFKREREGLTAQPKKTTPDNLWIKCESCGEIVFRRELEKLLLVCPKCGFHFAMPGDKYVSILADEGTWEEFAASLKSVDPLGFRDQQKYSDRLSSSIRKTGHNEAISVGTCAIG